MKNFTNLFSQTKTIRMELIPENENAKCLRKDSLAMQKSLDMANAYKTAKEILDEYYRRLINEKLNSLSLSTEKVNYCFDEFIKKRGDKNYVLPKSYEDTFIALRKSIADSLTDAKKLEYRNLLNKPKGKETSKIIDFIESEYKLGKISEFEYQKQIKAISLFESFVGYFDGYKENRNNMFSANAEVTAISNRLINENMLFYFENCFRLEKIKQVDFELYSKLTEIIGEYTIPANYVKIITQDKIIFYNNLIGHKRDDKFAKGCNQLINEAKQKNPDLKKKVQLLTNLQNMILFRDSEQTEKIEIFENDKELLNAISNFIENNLQSYINDCNVFFEKEFDFSSCFILSNKLSKLSQILFESENESYGILKRKLIENEIKVEDFISLKEIENHCNINISKLLKEKVYELSETLRKNIVAVQPILALPEINADRKPPKTDKQNDKGGTGFQQIGIIKKFFDSIIEMHRFFMIFSPELDGKNVLNENADFDFYGTLEDILSFDNSLYIKAKNYISKKPYSNDKIRVYFENNANFLNGFVESKTENSDNGTQYGGYLFRKKNSFGEYDYYLGCCSDAKLFREYKASSIPENDKSEFERFYYYQPKLQTIYNGYRNQDGEGYDKDKQKLKDCIKNVISKNGLSFDYLPEETPTAYLSRLNKENYALFNTVINDNEFISLQNSVIENLKIVFKKYEEKIPILKHILAKDYKSLKEFISACSEIEQNKTVYYASVSKTEFENVYSPKENSVAKKFYFFKIQNKDLKDKSERKNKNGTDNLHTMYFKALMSENQKVFDIGSGMIFFREQNYSAKKIVHKENQLILNKTPDYQKKESVFKYPITKDKRYFSDKFFLHLSFTINYTKKDLKLKDLNANVNKYIYENRESVNIIGIDRGERNLIYISVINQKGEILYQNSMNNISYTLKNDDKSKTVTKDYHKIIDNRVKERENAQKNWGVIDNIKEIKDGYLSQVVHEISMLMIRYNAVIVMENLNPNFKHSRISVDNQIYQKFEKALLDKLSYFVIKKDEEIHGQSISAIPVTNGLQLSVSVKSFSEIKDQNGFMFYVWPQYTSKICPKTGFVSLFDTSEKSIAESKKFFEKFESIEFDGRDFKFKVSDYSKFIDKKNKMIFTDFTITSKGERYMNKKMNGKWQSEMIEPSKDLKKLLEENGIDFSKDIKSQIVEKKYSASFYFELMKIFKSIIQMRNSKSGDGNIDYILSPIADENGNNVFDSRNICENLPKDADANGAYHIALKGLMALKSITPDGKIKISNSNNDWFAFAQKKEYLK